MTKLTQAQIKAIIHACDNASERERQHANEMKEIRPQEAERIEREKEIFCLGVQTAYYQIMRAFGEI
jgi:hypothetical protein